MAKCSGCKIDREKADKPLRDLHRLPGTVTNSNDFKRKALPVELCEFCDGDALDAALAEVERRSQ